MGKYKTIVWIDADSLICDELDEIWMQDYEIACTNNYWLNIPQNQCVFHFNAMQYIHGGLIASSSDVFWNTWDYANRNYANITCKDTYFRYWGRDDNQKYFQYADNDILNVIYHYSPLKKKILDGDFDPDSPNKKCWYGCSVINRENRAYIENDKIMIDNKPMKIHHYARGSDKDGMNFRRLGFSEDVSSFMDKLGS